MIRIIKQRESSLLATHLQVVSPARATIIVVAMSQTAGILYVVSRFLIRTVIVVKRLHVHTYMWKTFDRVLVIEAVILVYTSWLCSSLADDICALQMCICGGVLQ